MAPGLTAEGQMAFLVSCIRCSNNGKVFPPNRIMLAIIFSNDTHSPLLQIDFEAVAKDCNIVTKAAA